MKLVTHVLATTAGVQALHLQGREALLAFAFGVAIDVDHAIKLPFYVRAIGWKNRLGFYWRSSLQEPVALLWIVPLCCFLRTWIPVPFFLAHLAMDYSVRFEKMPFYPYSTHVTRGWLLGISDGRKEGVLFFLLVCTNLLLYWKPV